MNEFEYFRRGRASTRKRFNTLGYSCGDPHLLPDGSPSLVACDSRLMKKVLDFWSLLEWRIRETLVGDKGGGGNPLRHRGKGVRPCVWKEVPEQVSSNWQAEDQELRRVSWMELVWDRDAWRQAVKTCVAPMRGGAV